MSNDSAHPSVICANTKLDRTESNGRVPEANDRAHESNDCVQESNGHVHDPSLPPQRHAGLLGLGPNYPTDPGLGDQLGGVVEQLKGKILGKPEVVEHGRERRTGELTRKERKRDNAADPFEVPRAEGE